MRKFKTNAERFPVGTRVRVHAPTRAEGTDYEMHGREGTVKVARNDWIGVKLDKPPRYWRNPVHVCAHNLRSISSPSPTPAEITKE